MEVKGPPPLDLIEKSPRKKMFFNDDNTPKIVVNSRGRKRIPNTRDLKHVLRTNNAQFIDFIEKCLEWRPEDRMTPEQGLKHEWIYEILKKARRSVQR